MPGNKVLAAIEYGGQAGISQCCKEAVLRYIQFGEKIHKVRILSNSGDHCLLMYYGADELVAFKSGFGSGYAGEGPRTFSEILALLDAMEIDIREIQVESALIERLDNSALRVSDIEKVEELELSDFGSGLWRGKYIQKRHIRGRYGARI